MRAYNTSNNFLQISCCEFEYFSINKRYTSRRRQRNERTKSQNELAWTYSAFIHENIDIHNRVRTPRKCSPWIYLPFSKQSIEAIARGSTSLVWHLLSYEKLYLLPWIWIRLRLSYWCLSQKISGREIAGVWKLAGLVTADWSIGDFQRWREM